MTDISAKPTDNPQSPLWKRRLYLPTYTVKESAHYAITTPHTVAYWHYRGGTLGPALPGKEYKKPLSYLQLVEVAFVATFRKEGLSLQKIRKAREYASKTFNSEFPFVEYRWQTEGKHLLLDLEQVEKDAELGKLIVADKSGQVAWKPVVAERFKQFEYVEGLALIWHVIGRDSPIIIDPRIAFGAPTVKGIPTWVLKGRWIAGESIPEIKDDFKIQPEYIRYALDFEGILTVRVS